MTLIQAGWRLVDNARMGYTISKSLIFLSQETVMPTTFNGALPVEIFENDAGLVCIRQVSASGEEQSITLGLEQAEHLANWCIQYARTAIDDLMEE